MNQIIQGDSREKLKSIKSESVRCCVTSPPYYGLRDYGADGQIGLEQSPEEYVQQLVEVFREVKRTLMDDGTLWLNLGDSYAGSGKGAWLKKTDQKETYVPNPDSPQCKIPKIPCGTKPKDLIGIPWMAAFALRADGWYLRSDIIWNKPNAMPESVTDRPTKSHEYIFLFSKNERYYYDSKSIKEPAVSEHPSGNGFKREARLSFLNADGSARGNENVWEVPKDGLRNKRSVWTVTTANFAEAHFATFPEKLIEPCIIAGSEPNDTVLDPFFGAGTTGLVALQNDRNFIGIELNPEYIAIAESRLSIIQPVISF